MDSQEQREIQKAIREGRPETDEGPYYHDSWWESYKGSIKGKLGGAIIGALVGAVVGTVAVAVIALLAPASAIAGSAGLVIASFAGGGLLYGQNEFSNVGTVTGAVAAATEKAEERMKSFEKTKFAEIKEEISELKTMVGGKSGATLAKLAPLDKNDDDPTGYHTTHCDEHCQPGKPIFWKVALMGLAVGAGIGAVIAASPLIAVPIMTALGFSEAGLMATSVTTFGLIGASFGINRDLFRRVFDNTDLWFKGITHRANSPVAVSKECAPDAACAEKGHPVATTIMYDGQIDYPVSKTFHRDRVLAGAEKSLLSFDHTRATPQ